MSATVTIPTPTYPFAVLVKEGGEWRYSKMDIPDGDNDAALEALGWEKMYTVDLYRHPNNWAQVWHRLRGTHVIHGKGEYLLDFDEGEHAVIYYCRTHHELLELLALLGPYTRRDPADEEPA